MSSFASLSRREQVLVAILFLIGLPCVLWFLAAVPLLEARDRAIATLAAAKLDYVWVVNQNAVFEARSQAPLEPGVAPAGLAGVEAALVDTQLRDRVANIDATSQGVINLQLRGARFEDFGRLLDRIERGLGYRVTDMRILPTPERGIVNTVLELTPL